jgi:DNA-binding MarR family transcriptional regulator
MERLSLLAQLSNLRKVVHDMEVDLGLASLERKERDILLAFYATGKPHPEHGMIARTEAVRQHPTLSDISQPTFHRALRRLVERGLINRPSELPPGTYRLHLD